MLDFDFLGLSDEAEREEEESSSDTPDEVKFACVYFAWYPYIYANN